MSKKLVIVESPAKAKTITKYLGSDYIVRATFGHILDLATKGTKSNLGVDIDNGFKPKYILNPDKKDKVDAIVSAARGSSFIYLAADKDREGEAIAFHIAEKIKKLNIPYKRITFDEITKSALKKAVENPKELDKNLYDAQTARRVLDRLVGFMVSPYLMNLLGNKLSAGRVQSVCLKLIVEREKEILSFVPDTYWDITATLSKDSEKFIAKYINKITDEATAKKIKKELEEINNFIVSDVDKLEQKKPVPPPFTTSKLQQTASAKYKFSAKKTMQIAQKLYEEGLITYIRSDSTRCSPESISMVRAWIKSNNFDLPSKPNTFKNKDASQDAHEAIRPTDINAQNIHTSSSDEGKIYNLIWRRFVASQMKPAIFDVVNVIINCGKYKFKAQGKALKYKGWLNIEPEIKSKDVVLPILNVGDNLTLVSPKIKLEKKETKPPARYSEGTLVEALEKKGIGRPSTYASIIEKISYRNYVKKEKNTFVPTSLGIEVSDVLSKHFSFMKYTYTANMENELDKIADGKLKYLDMMEGFFKSFSKELKEAKTDLYKDGGQDCEKCGKRCILKHGMYGYFICCPDYPNCKFSRSVEFDGKEIKIKEFKKIVKGIKCPDCDNEMFYRDGKFGPFLACIKYPKCYGKRKIPIKKCPKCKKYDLYITIMNGVSKLCCMGYSKIGCRHIEDAPSVVDPNDIMPVLDKKVENILKKF